MMAEVQFVENMTFGWGFLARLHKGTTILLQRRYVHNEIWMPAEIHIEGSARILLFKKIRINTTVEFFNYKKYSVKTSVSFPGRN